MAIGLALLVLVTRLDYHFWRRIAVPMMLVVMLANQLQGFTTMSWCYTESGRTA
ncbi:hypothetical protein HUU05_07770 [candidate division KSB1 bacterium]|nr:hypothetical protein [candidate division KSB1 bacterium]